jgi:hypothetical protein
MTGIITFDYNKHCQLQFGSYVPSHESLAPTNTARTVGAICLGPDQASRVRISFSTYGQESVLLVDVGHLPAKSSTVSISWAKADNLELLTFYDRKGRLIGESETPGVSDSTDTTNPPDDGLGDFIPPTVAEDTDSRRTR